MHNQMLHLHQLAFKSKLYWLTTPTPFIILKRAIEHLKIPFAQSPVEG